MTGSVARTAKAAVAGLAVLVWATPAGAGVTSVSSHGYRYLSDTSAAPDASQVGLQVQCPGDEPVVGGGVAAYAGLVVRAEINTTQPYDADADGRPDDGWEAYIDNTNSDGAGVAFDVFAICDKRAAETDYRYVVKPGIPAPEGAQTRADATCPRDYPVVSGGVRSSGFLEDEMHVNTSGPRNDHQNLNHPPSDGWVSYVDNAAYGATGMTLTAFAICDKRREVSDYAYRSKVASSFENEQDGVSKRCPEGAPLVGGGMGTSGSFADRIFATRSSPAVFSASAPTAFVARVNNLTGGDPGRSVAAFAICRR